MTADNGFAIHLDNKTETRRIVSPQPPGDFWLSGRIGGRAEVPLMARFWRKTGDPQRPEIFDVPCPYGKIGDLLYVREPYYQFGSWEEHKPGRWKFTPSAVYPEPLFELPNHAPKVHVSRNKANPRDILLYKRLARFMPKTYARSFLEITNIRCHRLLDISDGEARREGIKWVNIKDEGRLYFDYIAGTYSIVVQRVSFFTLWEYIHGHGKSNDNPWVWAIEFRRIPKEEFMSLAAGSAPASGVPDTLSDINVIRKITDNEPEIQAANFKPKKSNS